MFSGPIHVKFADANFATGTLERPGDPEPEEMAAEVNKISEPDRGAEAPRPEKPGASAENAAGAITR